VKEFDGRGPVKQRQGFKNPIKKACNKNICQGGIKSYQGVRKQPTVELSVILLTKEWIWVSGLKRNSADLYHQWG